MQTLQEQGLVAVDESGIQVTAKGWFFVRAVAMVFDRYLQNRSQPGTVFLASFSKR